MKVTILGCGGSGGVPILIGGWGSCDPHNLKNRRRRSSILVQYQETAVLVDTSPDLREQLLSVGSPKLDGVLLTHDHYDHTGGLDDLRPYYILGGKTAIPVLCDPLTFTSLHQRFPYMFTEKSENNGGRTYPLFLNLQPLPASSLVVKDLEIQHFIQDHGFSQTIGYKFNKKMAYSTDLVRLTDDARQNLYDLDVWIVDCMSVTSNPTHSHLDQTLSWVEEFKPKRAYLTHMNHTLDYENLLKQLPENVWPCYDGLVIEV